MELTQIKGGNIGNKISLQDGGNKIEAEKNLIADSKLAHFAEIEKEAGGVSKISASHEEHNVKINGKKVPINQSRKVEVGDTISFGENKENIFAVHEKGEEISKESVKSHLEKAGHEVSDEEFKEILEKLNLEEKIIRGLFVGLLAVSIFLTGTIFFLNSQNSAVSKKIYETLNDKNEQIQELQELIGQNPEIECDPTVDEGCELETLDLFAKIENLEQENKKLEKQISEIGGENQKILQEKISQLEEKISANQEIEFDEATKLELSNIIHSVIEEINSFKTEENSENDSEENLEKISELEGKISEIQNSLSGEELDFGENGEKVGQAVKILLNKIMQLQKEIDELK